MGKKNAFFSLLHHEEQLTEYLKGLTHVVKHIPSRGSEHKIRQLSSTPNTHTHTHSAPRIRVNPHHLEEETYAKAIWTETVRFYPRTHNYAVNPDHMCGCRCQLSITKTSGKTCVLSHVRACVMTARGRNSIQLIGKADYIIHTIMSQQWCHNSPALPPLLRRVLYICYHDSQGAVLPKETGAHEDTCAAHIFTKK